MIRAYQAAHGGSAVEVRRRPARGSRWLAAVAVIGMALAAGTVQHFAAARIDAGRAGPNAWTDATWTAN